VPRHLPRAVPRHLRVRFKASVSSSGVRTTLTAIGGYRRGAATNFVVMPSEDSRHHRAAKGALYGILEALTANSGSGAVTE